MAGNNNPEIILIGAAILDVLVRPASPSVFGSGSYPAEEIAMSVGADALNEATILARLGKNVRLETVIGADDAGNCILEHCRRCGIQIAERAVRKEYTTGINVVLVQENGARNFLTNANGTLRKLTLKDIQMPFADSAGIVCFASIFVFPKIGVDELKTIFSKAKSQGKIVCADMTKRKNNETVEELAPALGRVDYLLPNDEEAMLLTGETTVEKAAEALWRTGVKNVIVKAGKRGCFIRNKEIARWISAVENVKCVDTTGAGDSFAAGFIYALSEGKELLECAEFANVCGAKAVQTAGATTWTRELVR